MAAARLGCHVAVSFFLLAAPSIAGCGKPVHVPGPPDGQSGGSDPTQLGSAEGSPSQAGAPGGPRDGAGESPPAPQAPAPQAPAPQAPAPQAPAPQAPPSAAAADRAALERPASCTGVPPLKLTLIASDLSQPTYVAAPPGDPARLFVLEKAGTIRIVKGTAVQPSPFLDIRSRVLVPSSSSEGGLLGLAFHPDYQKNGRFWLHYSAQPRGNVVIAEWKRNGKDADTADPEPVRTVVDVRHGAWNHVGGMLAFGRDGFLYAAIGDSARFPSPASDLTSKLGKILRFNVDDPTRAPAGNMTVGDPAIWDYGLRNPWRFSFDRLTGDLYLGDVGQRSWEEIDVEPAGKGRVDYGWDRMEGSHCYPPGETCTPRGLSPAIEHPRSEAGSIIGGYVYRGAKIPCLRGRYIYGDYVTARFFSFVWDGKAATDRVELTSALSPNGLPSSFGEDAAGELYVVMFNTGRVYRIDPGR